MKFLLGLMTSAVCMLSACSNGDEPRVKDSSNENKLEEICVLKVKYKNVMYDVTYKMEHDSIIYLDSEFRALYENEISKLPNLAVLTYKDKLNNDVVEYYETASELEKEAGIKYFNNNVVSDYYVSKSENNLLPKAGRAILYDDTNFKDRELILNIDYDYLVSIANLKDYDNFNDKASAIRVFNFMKPNEYCSPSYAHDYVEKGANLRTCLIGYEDSNFKGRALYCIATYADTEKTYVPETATHQDYKLKNIGWNDKISSLIFRIITVQKINDGTYTPHDPV